MVNTQISLVLGSHAHVPYGAEPGEFENVYINHVRPFVSNLFKFPNIQATLHYSGVLLHWLERSHPGLIMSIEEMVTRKQVEMLGGGFYEPMLPIISVQDKIGQIELMTTYLRKQFGKRPQGCWIPSFAWEQNLVSPLSACGMGFTFLSERQFGMAGCNSIGPCICEDQGKIITVFPVLHFLESALAEKSIDSLLESLVGKTPSQNVIVSIFPEKINVAKGESVDDAWCHFFEGISRCDNFVETISPGKLYKTLRGLPKVYFPDSTASEDCISPRRFIVSHPEALRIYSKMIFTNVLINQLRGDKSRKLSAHEELWKSQGNVLFCRTGKQGIHNRLFRNAAYSAILGAERVTREKGKFPPSLVPFDFNMDGTAEWLFRDAKINCYVQSPGGGVYELDYVPGTWNYLDTCGGRFAFADRLLPADASIEKLEYGAVDGARICRDEFYEPVNPDKVLRKLSLVLRQSNSVPFENIEIEKLFSLKKDTMYVGYTFANRGTANETFQFAPEIDLALPGEGDSFARFFACKAGSADALLAQPVLHAAGGIKIHDIKNEVQITLTANRLFDCKISPLYFHDPKTNEKLYQAYCLMPLYPISLEPGASADIEFALKFSH